jgi:DNA-binding transcriptional MerR regulator
MSEILDSHAPHSEQSLLQIGDVAERVGLSLRTVRYYEEMGLVSPPSRSEGGFRLYSGADVERLLALKRMKALGLALDEMGALADLIDRSAEPDAIETPELEQLVQALRDYASQTDAATSKLERHLAQARELRIQLGEQLGRCAVVLEQRDRDR